MHKSAIKLSIGLIVKNEEEYLEQCLESLKPLLEQLPSELLIADTGSDDRTVEIAKRYTEHVFTYRWEDDFAKARNFVLDQAQGEWFMQMDADEKLESAEPIVSFFRSGEAVQYNDISVCFRHYMYDVGETYTEDRICRFFRIAGDRKYKGKIHETVPVVGPVKYLDAFIYHYGYIQKKYSGRKVREKRGRNLPLLIQAVQEEPKDARLLYHLAQEYVIAKEFEPAKKVLEAVIQADRNAVYIMYAPWAFWNLNGIYLLEKQYDKTIETMMQYFEAQFETDIITLTILVNTLKAFMAAERYEEAIPYFERFFSSVRDIKDKIGHGRTDLDSALHEYDGEFCEVAQYQYVYTLQQCGKYGDALEQLKKILGESGYKTVNLILTPWLTELEELKCYEDAADYYRSLRAGSRLRQEIVHGLIMGFWETDRESAVKISELLAEDQNDPFSAVLKLLLRDEAGETVSGEEAEAVLAGLAPELHYQEVLCLSLIRGADISAFLGRCTVNRVGEFARELYEKHADVRRGLLAGTFRKEEYQSLKEVLFFATLREQVTMDGRISLKQLHEVLGQYVDETVFYAESLYRPEFLEPDGWADLPDGVAFALHLYEGLARREEGDLRGYLTSLQEALQACPGKNKIVERLTREVEQELKEQADAGREFEAYGSQIKAIIRDMIRRKDYAAAREALMAYEQVNPTDADTLEMKAQVGMRLS